MPTSIKAALLFLAAGLFDPAGAENHRVLMLNAASADPNDTNVFEPALLHAEVGDTVTFVPAASGHNSASKRGMLPEGASAWNGGVDEEITITLSEPGLYGYFCVPHYEMGMVGVIVVGGDLSNLDSASKVRHPGQSRRAFRELLSEVEQSSQ